MLTPTGIHDKVVGEMEIIKIFQTQLLKNNNRNLNKK